MFDKMNEYFMNLESRLVSLEKEVAELKESKTDKNIAAELLKKMDLVWRDLGKR